MIAASDSRRRHEPLRVWLIVLGTVFATETAVMVLLPWIVPSEFRRLETAVDAILLTAVLAPLLWRMVVRPLQEARNLRDEFLTDLFESIEADRRQTAHDLHDGVGQSLTLLVSGLRSAVPTIHDPDVAQRCSELKQLAKHALVEIKRLALGLRPALLDDLGLVPALERITADVRENHPIELTLKATDMSDARLPGIVETTLFRITQEALANIVTHSKAANAFVGVRRDGSFVELEVADDGIGIPAVALSGRNPGHLGLTGIRERTTLLGGELHIDSTPGQGTRLIARLPIRGEKT